MVKLFALMLLSLSLHINAADKTVSLCTMENWHPYVGQSLPNNGYAAQIVDEAFALQGYKVIRHWMPWKRVVVEAKQGERCNAASEIYHTKKRENWLKYSNPYAAARMVIFTKKNRNFSFENITDLATYKIGLIRGTAISAEFDQASFLNKKEVNTLKQGMEMLYANRLDFYVTAEMSAKYFINNSNSHYNKNNEALVALEPELNIHQLHLGFSIKNKGNIVRMNAFNLGLDRLKASGRYDAILREHGLN
mgnify:FL=1